MNNLNPFVKIAKSKGVDLPVMTVYLAGRISGDTIDLCLEWRKNIINYYKNYKGKGQYPISFLCPLNSGESDSIDEKGLTSSISSNLIYDKDLLSVKHADVIVANMDDFFEEDIKEELNIITSHWENNRKVRCYNIKTKKEIDFFSLADSFTKLKNKIITRRENIGTVMEVAWALLLNKPVVLIVPERRKETFEKHPFTKRASVIVSSVDELLENKWLNILYKSISGAIYE